MDLLERLGNAWKEMCIYICLNNDVEHVLVSWDVIVNHICHFQVESI